MNYVPSPHFFSRTQPASVLQWSGRPCIRQFTRPKSSMTCDIMRCSGSFVTSDVQSANI